jgi:hypothetical protein
MTIKKRLMDLIKGMWGHLDAVILAGGDATPY